MDITMNAAKTKADLRERQAFTEEQKTDLLNAWQSGMTSTKKKDMIQKLVVSSGLSEERIKNWIGNQKSKDGGKKYIKKKSYKRGPSGYSLFASTMKKGNKQNTDYFLEVSSEWKRLPEEKKEEFNTMAKSAREAPFLGKSKDQVIMEQLKMIKNAAMVLESVGYAIGGVGLDPKDPNNIQKSIRFFTSNAEKILDNHLFQKFENFFSKGEQDNSDKDKTDALRKKLRDHLKKSWENSTGLKSNLPYSKIMNGTLETIISGLPEGVSFKEPSAYGFKTISKLLDSNISFQIISSINSIQRIPEMNILEENNSEQDQNLTPSSIALDINPQNDMNIQEGNNAEKDQNSTLSSIALKRNPPQNDIDLLINQIKSSEEALVSANKKQKKRSSKTALLTESELDKRKWFKVEKIIRKRGTKVLIKWADGSSSWEPSSSLATEDVHVE